MCLVHEYITAVGDIFPVRLKSQLWKHTKFYSFVSKKQKQNKNKHTNLQQT